MESCGMSRSPWKRMQWTQMMKRCWNSRTKLEVYVSNIVEKPIKAMVDKELLYFELYVDGPAGQM